MRSKEEAHDYRYFPDPDLLPLELTQAYVDTLAEDLPELPDEKRARFIKDYGLSPYDADVLVAERESVDYFEAVAKGRDAKQAANWVINELFGRLNKEGGSIVDSPITADQLGAILDLIKAGTISGKIAKDVFDIVWTEGGDPAEIVEKRGLKQVTDIARHREGGRRGHRREPGQGGAGQAEARADRLVRRPGDEGDGRQGEPAGRERPSQIEARHRVERPSSTGMTHAIRVHEYGGPEVLTWDEVEVGGSGSRAKCASGRRPSASTLSTSTGGPGSTPKRSCRSFRAWKARASSRPWARACAISRSGAVSPMPAPSGLTRKSG